jgi:predicted deacetylase
MNEQDRAVARACLVQAQLAMTELRSIKNWWALLSERNRQEYKDFAAAVDSYLRDLKE